MLVKKIGVSKHSIGGKTAGSCVRELETLREFLQRFIEVCRWNEAMGLNNIEDKEFIFRVLSELVQFSLRFKPSGHAGSVKSRAIGEPLEDLVVTAHRGPPPSGL